MEGIEKLALLFEKFPGIGPRQAKRFVYFLLTQPDYYINSLTELMSLVRKSFTRCSRCYRYFKETNLGKVCDICSDKNRDLSKLYIVEKDADLEALKKVLPRGSQFFVLGGLIPLLDKEPSKKVRLEELKELSKNCVNEGLNEIVLALAANPQGDHTEAVITQAIMPILGSKAKITRLGRGLSTGSELEYADPNTLRAAVNNRTEAI